MTDIETEYSLVNTEYILVRLCLLKLLAYRNTFEYVPGKQ